MTYLVTFANNLLPILLLASAGFALGKLLKVDPQPLGRVLFYILSPVLVFKLLTQNALPPGSIAGMMGFAIAVMCCTGALAFLAGRLFRLERSALIAVVLTALVGNNGNYGLPLIAFAFGEQAEAYASVYFVTSVMLVYTVGILVASAGHLSLKQALLGLVKIPVIYAILLAVLFILTGWELPELIMRPVNLASAATVPAMLIMLGLELSRFEKSRDFKALSIPVVIQLVIAPLIGFLLAPVFNLQDTSRQAGITETGMPTAVTTIILASEYKLDRQLVNAIVFTSTVLSPLTLTPLLVLLAS